MNRAVLAVVLLAAPVAAADPVATARLDASGTCELTPVTTRTNELLSRTAIDPNAQARITATTGQDRDTWRASLVFTDENGIVQPARTVDAASCDELAESVAIVISLVLREAPPPPPPPAAPPVVPNDDTSYVPSPIAMHRALELGAAMGTAESAIVLGGRIERRRTALGADLAVTLPETVDLGAGATRVMSVRLDAAGCWRASGFAACGLVIGGLVGGRGEDLMDARTAVRPIAGLAARAEWRQAVSQRLGVRVFATFEQLLVRPSFLVDAMPVWTSPWRQAWLGAGIFLRMP